MHVGNARLNTRRLYVARAGYSCGLALLVFLFGSKALQNAVAEGDTRTISLHHIHTDEDITITFKRDGRYDDAALEKLNWFLRDWRRSEQTNMDPHLIDLVWEVQRESGSKEPIQVVCGYRSPATNAMLRRRSAGVARFSQHMLGHAMDFYIAGVPLEQLREYGLRLQRGGVGFYPESGSPFVHMDTAGIRMWPRMSHEELARVFPDGRTVHIPTDGHPLSGYVLALAEVRKRGSEPSANSIDAARTAGLGVDTVVASNDQPSRNPFAKLLGFGKNSDKNSDDDEDAAADTAPAPAVKHPVIAAIAQDAKAAGKATANAVEKVAAAASKAKLIRTADAAPMQPPAPAKADTASAKLKLIHVAPVLPSAAAPAAAKRPDGAVATAAVTPNQIIASRGYWQGPADAAVPAGALQRNGQVASADATGSVGPFVDPRNPNGDADQALAYADASTAAPTGIDALRAAAIPAQQAPNGTTVAVKRVAAQVSAAVMTASASSITVIKAGPDFENPWLRAIVLSPSVRRFLTTVALGAHDFRSLAEMMVKPRNAVMMSFAADPNPGLANDHFSGAAIVFVSTISYPTRTASLQ